MRHPRATRQANPDPLSPGSPSAPRRRWGRRWGRVLLLALLAPLVAGVFGWFRPTEALRLGLSLVFIPIVNTAVITAMEYDGVISIFPKGARPRWIVWAVAVAGGVLCGVAALVGAWLAR